MSESKTSCQMFLMSVIYNHWFTLQTQLKISKSVNNFAKAQNKRIQVLPAQFLFAHPASKFCGDR